jgi:hypothetical protein
VLGIELAYGILTVVLAKVKGHGKESGLSPEEDDHCEPHVMDLCMILPSEVLKA